MQAEIQVNQALRRIPAPQLTIPLIILFQKISYAEHRRITRKMLQVSGYEFCVALSGYLIKLFVRLICEFCIDRLSQNRYAFDSYIIK